MKKRSGKKSRMASTLSPLAQPTGLHCTGAGGLLSPSDPLQLLALITALCPYTVQMGPFVGLSWSLGVMGRGQARESRRGLPWGFTLSFKEGRETQNTGPEKQAVLRKAEREPFLYTALFSWLCGWNILSSKTQGYVAQLYGRWYWARERQKLFRESLSHIARVWVTWQTAGCHWLQMFSLWCLNLLLNYT